MLCAFAITLTGASKKTGGGGGGRQENKPTMTAHGQNNHPVIRLECGRNTDNQPLPGSVLFARIFLERTTLRENSSWEIQSGCGLSLGAESCYSHRPFVCFHQALASPPPYFPCTFPLLVVHAFSQGETTWILKAQAHCLREHAH